MKSIKNVLLLLLLATVSSVALAQESTWSFTWDKNKTSGGQGFYNFGSNYLNQDSITTELNGLNWTITSPETNYYTFVPKSGQAIGKPTKPASHATIFTTDLIGKVTKIKVTARKLKDKTAADISASVNGVAYGSKVSLTNDLKEYEFTVPDAPQEGKIEIVINQTSKVKSTLYIKSLAITYKKDKAAAGLVAPTFSLAGGRYDEAQENTITVEGMEAGTYKVLYTLDGSSPKLEGSKRTTYTSPIKVDKSMTIKAVTIKEGKYSEVTEARYVVRQDAGFHFVADSYTIESPDNEHGLELKNPNGVKPIKYASSDESVCVVDQYGDLYSVKPGVTTITASYLGDAVYRPTIASYVLTVKAKKPLKAPRVSPMGGTFNGPVEVLVDADDERALTIWLSTTAKDSTELVNKPKILPSKAAKIIVQESCRLLIIAAGDNVFSPVVEANFVINTTGIEALEQKVSQKKTEIYTLDGKKVTNITQPGIYIVNGKKMMLQKSTVIK